MDREVIREMVEAMHDAEVKNDRISYPALLKAALIHAGDLGFKLLPREPSEEMLVAGIQAGDAGINQAVDVAYQAMWDAAGEKP